MSVLVGFMVFKAESIGQDLIEEAMSWVGNSPIHIKTAEKLSTCCDINVFLYQPCVTSTGFLIFYCETIYLVSHV